MPAGFRGSIFDVDGVLVDSPHERAWRDTLRDLMETSWSDIRSRTTYSSERFTARVYQNVVAGKPRMSGARAALDYFDVPDAGTRVDRYAELKQQRVVELIEAGMNAEAGEELEHNEKEILKHLGGDKALPWLVDLYKRANNYHRVYRIGESRGAGALVIIEQRQVLRIAMREIQPVAIHQRLRRVGSAAAVVHGRWPARAK